MADKKISALTAMTAPATADFLHVIDDNSGTYTNQKITLATLLTLAPGYLGFATVNAVTAAGALDITSAVTTLASSGAIAITLANGTTAGQVKIVTMITDGGTATLTPATLNGYTTIAFADDGDSCVLWYHGSTVGWCVIANNGCALA